MPRSLWQYNLLQYIPLRLSLKEIAERHASAPVQHELRAERRKHSEHIRKAVAPPDAAADRRQIPELHTDDLTQCVAQHIIKASIQLRRELQLPQRYHAANVEFLLILLNSVEAEIGEINRGIYAPSSHFQPHHPANHTVRLFLIQRPGLLKAGRSPVILYLKHCPLRQQPSQIPIVITRITLGYALQFCKSKILLFRHFPAKVAEEPSLMQGMAPPYRKSGSVILQVQKGLPCHSTPPP